MTPLDYFIVIAFLTIMALAGFAITRLIRDSDDFFVAGRELTPFILCATITATNLSMFHFVGMGGTAYQNGVSIIWQNWTGDMALVLAGIFIVPVMRRLRIRSVPEFLQLRYSPWLRMLVGGFWGLRLCAFLGILLYLAATTAGIITGYNNYAVWLMAFSLVSVLYSVIGGAWAVAIMDSVQFVIMLLGGLIIFPVAMHAAGGLPEIIAWLKTNGREHHVEFVPVTGEYNWLFIIAITLLSLKWASIDQAILQRAFGARTPRIGAKGMVLAGIVTTPFAFFYILPGLAMTKLHPGFSNPDHAIPWLLSTQIPIIARGLLGVVLCGMLAAQISTITADVNSVATLFTSDVYRILRAHEPSQKDLLVVVRISSLMCGALMLLMAWILQSTGAGAVRANLAVVGILDMPLFVVTIIYGLLWKRANWQGAVAGFILGGIVGLLCYAIIDPKYFDMTFRPVGKALPGALSALMSRWHESVRAYKPQLLSIAPIASSLTALLVTPIISLLTRHSGTADAGIWEQLHGPSGLATGAESDVDDFFLVPRSAFGKAGVAGAVGGFLLFLCGVACAGIAPGVAPILAIGGMVLVFVGGLLRVYSR